MLQRLTVFPLKSLLLAQKCSFAGISHLETSNNLLILALQFSSNAERVIKENKIPDSQLQTIVGHGPRGLVMKADVLEVFHNVPKDKRFTRETVHIAQPAASAPKKVEKPSAQEFAGPFIDLPITNMRKVNFFI